MWDLEQRVTESAQTPSVALGFEPVNDEMIHDFFRTYSLASPIPPKCADHELGRAWCGYVDIPGNGMTIPVFIASFLGITVTELR